MAEAIREIKEIIKHIESELHHVKHRVTALELSEERPEPIRAAGEWLALVKKIRGKWSPKSPSSVEISRLGRRRARS